MPSDVSDVEIRHNSPSTFAIFLCSLAACQAADTQVRTLMLHFPTSVGTSDFHGILAQLPAGLQHLQLDLSGTKVSDAGLASLAQLPAGLQHLQLDLGETKVSDAGLASLAQLPAGSRHFELF